MREDIKWLIEKIKYSLEDCIRRSGPQKSHPSRCDCCSMKGIFSGSYDVWESIEDGPKYHKIMKDRLNEAKALGYIINESGLEDWKLNEKWSLTGLEAQE